MLLVMLFLLGTSILFSGGDAPGIFGHNIYVVNTDAFSLIKSGSAVVTEAPVPDEIFAGNIVIYSLDNKTPSIGEVRSAALSEGVYGYTVRNDAGNDFAVSQGQIIGKAVYYSSFLGAAVGFARSSAGIITIVVIPCLIIIVYEFVRFLTAGRSGPTVEPLHKQDEIPTVVPQSRLQAANAYKAATVRTPAERGAGYESYVAGKNERNELGGNSPLFTSPLERSRQQEQTAAAVHPTAPLSQKKLNDAIASANAERAQRERLQQKLREEAEMRRARNAPQTVPASRGASNTAELGNKQNLRNTQNIQNTQSIKGLNAANQTSASAQSTAAVQTARGAAKPTNLTSAEAAKPPVINRDIGTASLSSRSVIKDKIASDNDAVKIRKGPDDGDPTVKHYIPRSRQPRPISATTPLPNLDEILSDEKDNKRYDIEDILSNYGNRK